MMFPHVTRSYEYVPPRSAPSDLAQLAGLELLQRMLRGELAPPSIMQTLDYEMINVEFGHVVFAGTPKEWAYNTVGTVHGGYAATLLDTVVACAVHSTAGGQHVHHAGTQAQLHASPARHDRAHPRRR